MKTKIIDEKIEYWENKIKLYEIEQKRFINSKVSNVASHFWGLILEAETVIDDLIEIKGVIK